MASTIADPKRDPVCQCSYLAIDARELLARNMPDLIIDRAVVESMLNARNTRRVQIINGLKPELLGRALAESRWSNSSLLREEAIRWA